MIRKEQKFVNFAIAIITNFKLSIIFGKMDKHEEKKYPEPDEYVLYGKSKRPTTNEEISKRLFAVAVKAVIVRENDEILLIKRAKDNPSWPEKFDMPGGKLEKDENINSGLEREVKEETGITIQAGPIVYAFDIIKDYILENGKERRVYGKGFRLLAQYKGGEIKLSKEHESYEWIKIEQAIKKLEDEGFEKSIRDALICAKKYLDMEKSLDSWKRCQADFENYKKDQAKGWEEFAKFAKMDVVGQILPVLDNFEASLEHVPEKEKNSAWVEGITLIKRQIKDVLKNNGVEEIEAKAGDKFNPEIHEAVGGKGEKVKKVVQKGYKLNGRIVRVAKVEVE